MTAERRNSRPGLFGYAVIYILAKVRQSERLYFRPGLYLKAEQFLSNITTPSYEAGADRVL